MHGADSSMLSPSQFLPMDCWTKNHTNPKKIQREFKVVSSSSRVSSLASCLAARETENPLCLPHCQKDISTIKDLQD